MKRFFTYLLCISFMIAILAASVSAAVWDGKTPGATIAATFSGGDGTATSPYRIATATDLAQLAANVNSGIDYEGAYFVLTADIQLNDTASYARWEKNPPANKWEPIGASADKAFRGHFDGKSYTVSGLYLSTYISYAGLFGYVDGGSIENIKLTNVYVSGGDYVGAVAGYVTETVYFTESVSYVSNCSVEGYVNGSRYVGGVIGYTDVNVTNCINKATVSAERFAVGGIVGVNEGATISYSYSLGSVEGALSTAGGIVGKNTGAVSACYNVGAVEAEGLAGGVVGYNGGSVTSCFNAGLVSVTGVTAGGVVGENNGDLSISYNIGYVSALSGAYGVVGKRTSGTVESCYYLDLYGMSDASDCRGLSRNQFKLTAVFTDFDFTDTWTYGPSRYPYPVLREPDFDFMCDHNSVVTVETPCSCETDGAYKTECTVCETVLNTVPIEGGHAYVLTGTVAPTCTARGTYTYTCTICNDSYTTPFGQILSHEMKPWVTTKAATCAEDGAHYRLCKDCDYREDGTIPSIEHAYHSTVIEPDCNNGGYTEHVCAFCGDRYITDETGPLAHVYKTDVAAPGCEHGGHTVYTCTACDYSYVADEVPAVGHTPSEWRTVSVRSFTDNGIAEVHCTVCSAILDRTNEPAYGFLYLSGGIAFMGLLALIMIFVAAGANRKKEQYARLLASQQAPSRPKSPRDAFESTATLRRPAASHPYDEDDDEDEDEDMDEVLFREDIDDDDDDDDEDDWI